MSIDLPYVVRLYVQEPGRAVLRLGGLPRNLEQTPAIEGLARYTMLDYVPCVVGLIQPYAERVRDLHPSEREAILFWMLKAKGLW